MKKRKIPFLVMMFELSAHVRIELVVCVGTFSNLIEF